jgi:hypothetical protein
MDNLVGKDLSVKMLRPFLAGLGQAYHLFLLAPLPVGIL